MEHSGEHVTPANCGRMTAADIEARMMYALLTEENKRKVQNYVAALQKAQATPT